MYSLGREMLVTLSQLRQPAVICDGVGFRYGQLPALRDIGFRLERGELAFVVGPSASGKTTLLRLVHGQLRPSSGRLIVHGVEAGEARSARRLRREVGVVFPDYRLLESCTAVENLTYALRVADLGLARGEAGRRAAALLEEAGLGDRLGAYPRELSGGQRQRLAIARTLATGPGLLLADEPAAHLDDENAAGILGLLRQAARRGTAVLVATHETRQVATMGCRILALERGRLLANGRSSQPLRAAT